MSLTGESSEKTESQEKRELMSRPGYTYAASADQQPEQVVRVKLEIDGQIRIVPVCIYCHKVNRICSLDPNLTDAQIASAKYLGVEGSGDSESSDQKASQTEGNDEKGLSSDLHNSKDSDKSSADSGKSSKSEDEKKKKKKSDNSSDHRRRTLPETSWTTNKPSHEDWQKKKKKDL